MVQHRIRGRTAAAIASSIEQAIEAGAFAAAESLPTIRELAATLRVSPVTVAAAYRRLHDRGLVLSGGRRGTRLRPYAAVDLPAASYVHAPEGTLDLATGNPDPALLPPLDAALRAIDEAPRLYGDAPVLPGLLRFAQGELAADGLPAGAVAVTSGALDAVERLLREHLRPGDRVAVEDPTLPPLLDLVGAAGFAVEPMAMDAEGPRPDAFEGALARGVRALIVTPRAQNPTGAAISDARATDLRRLLRARPELLLIENDPAGPVAGAPPATLCGAHPRWAVVRSVSKFLGPDLRVAIIAGDALTIGRVAARQARSVRWVSGLLQQLTLALWSDPSGGRRLARVADVYAQRRTALADALAARGITITARSGFNIWIPVREETSAVQALAQRGWAVAPGERFRVRSGPGIRVTTSALVAEEAVRFAADCAEALRPSAAASA